MRKKRILQVLLAVVLLLCQLMTVSATGVDQMPDLETGKKGKLTVTLSSKNEEGKKVSIEGVQCWYWLSDWLEDAKQNKNEYKDFDWL